MHLLDIKDLSPTQIAEIFDLADRIKQKKEELPLSGKTFVLFFPESSIRTRISFEKGIRDLGGQCILFPPEALDKKEELRDIIQYIRNWAEGVIVRHKGFSKIKKLAENSFIPVINAMTSKNHPCEVLSDMYSIRERKENYKELVYTFVGPKSNISTSWMDIAKVLNLQFNHVCTSGNQAYEESINYKFHTHLENILPDSDVVLTDSLPNEYRTDEYIKEYQINLERMKLTRDGSVLNPCPPFYRSEEVSEDVISSGYFVGHSFKENLIYVQQAIILYCLIN